MSLFQKFLSLFRKQSVASITADFNNKVIQLKELATAKERESALIAEQIIDLKQAAQDADQERAKALAVADKISGLLFG